MTTHVDKFGNVRPPEGDPGDIHIWPEPWDPIAPTEPPKDTGPGTGVRLPAFTPSTAYLKEQVESPMLPPGAVQAIIPQQIQKGEELQKVAGTYTPPEQREIATGEVSIIDQPDQIKAAEFEADRAVAQEGTVTPESTIRGQMELLMGDIASGDAPWADEAMRNANAVMLERGLGQSSMAADAITSAVLEAAIPIAQYDASVFGGINLTNLRHRQETMLSNTSASNAAKQFNATSVNEVNRFMAGLRDGVMKHNATQKDAMDRFNAGEENASDQFYDKMEDAAEQFNATNTLAIAKSNVEWRRTINTANTAAENNANMLNAQNAFNISQQAMADLWQRSRDVFSWANSTAENERDRAYNLALYAIKRSDFLEDMETQEKNAFFGLIGDLVRGVVDDWSEKVFRELETSEPETP